MRNVMIILYSLLLLGIMFNHCVPVSHGSDFKSRCETEARTLEQFRGDMVKEGDIRYGGLSDVKLEKITLDAITCIEEGSIGQFIIQISGNIDDTCLRLVNRLYVGVQDTELDLFLIVLVSGGKC